MEKPNITKETTETLLETKFLKVFDLQYAPGKHYFDATRRSKENLVALQSEELCKTMLPDAVTCIVVLQKAAKEADIRISLSDRSIFAQSARRSDRPAGQADRTAAFGDGRAGDSGGDRIDDRGT